LVTGVRVTVPLDTDPLTPIVETDTLGPETVDTLGLETELPEREPEREAPLPALLDDLPDDLPDEPDDFEPEL